MTTIEITDLTADIELSDLLGTRADLAPHDEPSDDPAVVERTDGEKIALVLNDEPLTVDDAYAMMTTRARAIITADSAWRDIAAIDPAAKDDWMQSDACDQIIADAAEEHGVTPEQVNAKLASSIPDADTPRESIARAAIAIADYARLAGL